MDQNLSYSTQQGMISPMMLEQQNVMMSPVQMGAQPQIIIIQNQETPKWEPSDWKDGLCGCSSDIPICLCSFFCPCVQYGRNNEEILKVPCFGACISYYCLGTCGLQCCIAAPFRGSLRSKFNIVGGFAGDCLVHYFCTCCALSQEAREIKTRKFEAQEKGIQL